MTKYSPAARSLVYRAVQRSGEIQRNPFFETAIVYRDGEYIIDGEKYCDMADAECALSIAWQAEAHEW